jgi:cytochrome c553
MKRLWILAATISGALIGNTALPAGSVEAGATKAIVCQACHGANGNSINAEWPSLAGLGADYIAEQLKNFKDGKRNNAVMAPMAAP